MIGDGGAGILSVLQAVEITCGLRIAKWQDAESGKTMWSMIYDERVPTLREH